MGVVVGFKVRVTQSCAFLSAVVSGAQAVEDFGCGVQ